jgi:phosphopantothenoylcysteine decarboxylase/phosphopantothenate--cysteine ligase
MNTVLLGITGCIAAYKACELLRALQKAGANVKVVMTEHATEFVTPATFKALSGNEVAVNLISDPAEPIHHISLAQEANVFVIAPATANVINKLAAGVADDLLTTVALATQAPLIIAPAMNTHMWRNEATQKSLATLRARGVQIIEPTAGELACGDVGEGRLADTDTIAAATLAELSRSRDLVGRKLLVTAGATREYLDPVRFISSPASGLTGYLIAEEAARRGAEVTLVSGPTTLPDPFGVQTIRITSAQEMLQACQEPFQKCDTAIFTAAVADFRPKEYQSTKIKKQDTLECHPALDAGSSRAVQQKEEMAVGDQQDEQTIILIQNPDIIATLAAKKENRYIIGFAAETNNIIDYAKTKLQTKNADMIVANDVSDPTLGFASKSNKVWFITEDSTQETETITKKELANLILDKLV